MNKAERAARRASQAVRDEIDEGFMPIGPYRDPEARLAQMEFNMRWQIARGLVLVRSIRRLPAWAT